MQKKNIITAATIALIVIVASYILTAGSFSHVSVEGNCATVTINFMMPMDQSSFEESISVTPAFSPSEDILIETEWINENTVQLTLTETGVIRGQTVRLSINKANTQLSFLKKNKRINMDFKSEIEIVAPTERVLVASDNSFEVTFNTPIHADTLRKYTQATASFKIEAIHNSKLNGTSTSEATTFKFTPETTLENDQEYTILFKEGLTSSSKQILENDLSISIVTDKEPIISSITPPNNSNWIGIFPKIVITSDTPIQEAYLYTEEGIIQGQLIGEKKAIFYFWEVLKPDTSYSTEVQIISPTGEKSERYPLNFTTVPIKEDRIWMTIHLGQPSKISVYEGQEIIREIVCTIGMEISPTQMGTYYVLEKGDSYYNNETKEGANSWLQLSEGLIIHAILRDEYWKVIEECEEILGSPMPGETIMVSEEDGIWLFDNIGLDTMVIVLN
ncbi:MAG: hypothetical protein BEN18_01375 [Epulopiscium sp. Nuni2H_MBin001]|nr:MAG: hypothetical protein BEN18_01375 [Epulopiscium sp. Nuni2H_MBin001]